MSYAANILADSESPDGVRLTTMEVTFPRFILAEVNTHRMLSRNSASSRAIPTEKMIERVRTNPFVPETFNKRVKGMGVGEAFSNQEARIARQRWLDAADDACRHAEFLNEQGLDKSRANRLLEPFLWHTAIISATEWDNFFALRDHPAAQPEFRIVARLMREAMEGSTPQQLDYGQWHLPLISEDELAMLCSARNAPPDELSPNGIEGVVEHWKLVSAGRCARVSYDTHENFEPVEKSVERSRTLMGNGHFSPFEHVARPFSQDELARAENSRSQYADDCRDFGWEYDEATADAFGFSGNFRGWVQYRKEIPNESNFGLLEAEAA